MMRALFGLSLCIAGGAAVADASLGEMPAVDPESPILRQIADGHPMMFGSDLWMVFKFDDNAMRIGDTAPFANFADHVIAADTGNVVDYADWTDGVGLSYHPPYAVVIIDDTLADTPLINPEDDSFKTVSRLFQGDVEVARLARWNSLGSSSWQSHFLAIDIATLDRATVSECASRLAVATLYTTTIPEDFSFTRCAESIQ